GGDIDFEANLDLTISAPMTTASLGTDGEGGDVTFLAGTALTLQDSVNAQADDLGGSIDAEAGTVADVSDQLTVKGSVVGGSIFLSGCTVTVEPTGVLSALGPSANMPSQAVNYVQAGSSMTIAGTLKAGGQNVLAYLQPPPPVIAPGAVITPAATLI